MASRVCNVAVLLGLVWSACPTWATNVQVTGLSDAYAQVVVNGKKVHVLQIGESSHDGVKLVDVRDGVAVLRFDGQVHRLALGASNTSEVVVRLGQDGGYRTTALINRVAFPAIIDTGASVVTMTSVHARQLGIDYESGRRAKAQTANGPVDIFIVTLPSVQVGTIRLTDVLGSVLVGPQAATIKEVLIGNSFLRQVHMQRFGDALVLRR